MAVLESLKSSCDVLVSHMCDWMSEVITFTGHENPDDFACFWQLMGLTDGWPAMSVKAHVRWDAGQFILAEVLEDDKEVPNHREPLVGTGQLGVQSDRRPEEQHLLLRWV